LAFFGEQVLRRFFGRILGGQLVASAGDADPGQGGFLLDLALPYQVANHQKPSLTGVRVTRRGNQLTPQNPTKKSSQNLLTKKRQNCIGAELGGLFFNLF
jgi:hypothetical protein